MPSIRLQYVGLAVITIMIAHLPAPLLADDAQTAKVPAEEKDADLPERIDLLEQKVRDLAAQYIAANALLDEIWDELNNTTDRRDELDKAIQTYERILLQDAVRLDKQAGGEPAPPAQTPARVLETDGPATVAPGQNLAAVQQRLKTFREELIVKLEKQKQPGPQQPLPDRPSPQQIHTFVDLDLDLIYLPATGDINHSHWVGRFEITQQQYARIMGMPSDSNHLKLRTRILALPVENISWDEASMFCARLTRYARSAKLIDDGQTFRLPTASEWEHASRAGTTTAYSFGDDPEQLSQYAVCNSLSDAPQHVGSKQPNPWGLFDMHGNVAEWCHDASPENPEQRIIAGGNFKSPPAACTSNARTTAPQRMPAASTGFRVVLVDTDG